MNLRSLFTASALVTAGMLAGRVLGLLREATLAHSFGASHVADLAILLLMLPDFLTVALLGGGASATLVPAFASRSKEAALALLWQVMAVSVAAYMVIAVLIGVFHSSLGNWVNTGEGTLPLLLFLLSLPLTAATAVLTGWLQFRGRLMVPSFANSIFNLVIIAALFLLPAGLGMLAAGICAAALIRLLAYVVAFYRAEGWVSPHLGAWQLDAPLMGRYVAATGSSLLGMVPTYAPYVILASAGAGVALFNYAFKLILVPAMLAISVLQMALLPWLVARRHGGVDGDAPAAYTLILQVAWALSLAVCLALVTAGHDIVQLCFGHGRMTAADVDAVTHLFRLGVWALPGMALACVWQQMMFAREMPHPPLMANTLLALAVVPCCWLGHALAGLQGIALAYAMVQVLPVLWLAREGRRLGMVSRLMPSPAYVMVAAAMLAVWLPAEALVRAVSLPLGGDLALGMVSGALMLVAGIAAHPLMRAWAKQYIRY